MAMQAAREGDRLVLVACCRWGPVLVQECSRPAWRCKCGGRGKDRSIVVLGAPGEPWVEAQ